MFCFSSHLFLSSCHSLCIRLEKQNKNTIKRCSINPGLTDPFIQARLSQQPTRTASHLVLLGCPTRRLHAELAQHRDLVLSLWAGSKLACFISSSTVRSSAVLGTSELLQLHFFSLSKISLTSSSWKSMEESLWGAVSSSDEGSVQGLYNKDTAHSAMALVLSQLKKKLEKEKKIFNPSVN